MTVSTEHGRKSQTNEPITWEKYLSMPFAAQQIYGSSGATEYWNRRLSPETVWEEVFANEQLFGKPLLTREQYNQGFNYLKEQGYIILDKDGKYTPDKRCRHLVSVIMPYELAEAGVIPNT